MEEIFPSETLTTVYTILLVTSIIHLWEYKTENHECHLEHDAAQPGRHSAKCLRKLLPLSSGLPARTGYGVDDLGVGFRVPLGPRIFTSPRHPDRFWGPPSLLSKRVPAAIFPGIKRSSREADHWPPTSAEVKKTWIYTFTPPYVFMAQCLIRDNFTFTFRRIH
jgi:hypothetical protein